jgi:hypothetical protein
LSYKILSGLYKFKASYRSQRQQGHKSVTFVSFSFSQGASHKFNQKQFPLARESRGFFRATENIAAV